MFRRRQCDRLDSDGDPYTKGDVVDFYATITHLFPPEVQLLGSLSRTTRVLDLGVGAGRTTKHLADHVATYVGLDRSHEMVAACRAAHPNVDVRVGDAADLSTFEGGSFDVVLFSFNGIDEVSDDDRRRCLAETRRLLAPDGRFVLSRHNARCVVEMPRPLRGVAAKIAVARLSRAVIASVRLAARRVVSAAFWQGAGTYLDPTHGGMLLRVATPARALAELEHAGFGQVEGPLPLEHPRRFRWWRTPWYYLVVRPRSE